MNDDVEMRYKPERALTLFLCVCLSSHDWVEMRYKPERALTLKISFVLLIAVLLRGRNEV